MKQLLKRVKTSIQINNLFRKKISIPSRGKYKTKYIQAYIHTKTLTTSKVSE